MEILSGAPPLNLNSNIKGYMKWNSSKNVLIYFPNVFNTIYLYDFKISKIWYEKNVNATRYFAVIEKETDADEVRGPFKTYQTLLLFFFYFIIQLLALALLNYSLSLFTYFSQWYYRFIKQSWRASVKTSCNAFDEFVSVINNV